MKLKTQFSTESDNAKPTENLEQLMSRFTKRIKQVGGRTTSDPEEAAKIKEQLDYLRGCKDTVEYLMTGKLPNDGNHDGMKDHRPVKHNDLGALD